MPTFLGILLFGQHRQELTRQPTVIGLILINTHIYRAGANILTRCLRLQPFRPLAYASTHYPKEHTKDLFHENNLNHPAILDNSLSF